MSEHNIHSLPKVDLHLHLDGAADPETLWDLAQSRQSQPDAESFEAFRNNVQVSENCSSLNEFLDTFDYIIPLLDREEAVEQVAFELCRSLNQDHVIYAEIRFSPHYLANDAFPPEQVVEAVLKGLSRGEEQFSIQTGLILCCLHHIPDSTIEQTIDLALQYQDQGVVGVDLAGREDLFQTEPLIEPFQHARSEGLGITIHAGESGPVEHIARAIDELGAQRIGHGLKLLDDQQVMNTVIEENITIEMCLTSNLHTNCVGSLQTHPFPAYYEKGVPVTLNTDDPAISNITLSDEYELAEHEFNLQKEDFYHLNKTAIHGAFLSEEDKNALFKTLKNAYT